ncbi:MULTISPECIES: alpha/beta fold hydrolase [unclassified Brevibacterium]|uniref:alpha/beta fold hydrolase n=1 Tax=unclassified Brevibacterium TaxID=2614124 RepID=UPI001092B78D|nr:alpha/beta fold hydrolase [Brevibacterium sp. S22]TGD33041.1 alpha/beta fold hydrolase [Brevibacterium sp. S22]
MRIAVRAFNDNPGSPVLVFGNALGTRMPLWTPVAARLADDYQIYLTDLPGHTVANGGSAAPLTVEALASGVVESLAEVGVESFAYCGVSISGAVGLTLALNHPDVLTGLIACATAEKFGTPESWDERIGQVRADGTRSIVDDTADRWFAAGFLGEDIATGHLILSDLALVDDEVYSAAASALKTYDLSGKLGSISTPTLVVAGAQDPGCTPEAMSEMAQQIEGAHFVTIPDSAHLSMVEHPEIVADHIQEFCGQL